LTGARVRHDIDLDEEDSVDGASAGETYRLGANDTVRHENFLVQRVKIVAHEVRESADPAE
jgi:hypothetical protein